MSENTTWSLSAIRSYIAALEAFKSQIEGSCNDLESGISSCQTFMQDSVSQSALRKGKKVSEDIKACLKPAQKRLEKLREIEAELSRADQYEM